MKRHEIFGGTALVIVGLLLTLDQVWHINVSRVIGPLFLIALGVWVFWRGTTRSGRAETAPPQHKVIPLEGARRARVRIDHGAGRLAVDASADYDELLDGTFGHGVQVRRIPWEDGADIHLKPAEEGFPFSLFGRGGAGLDWNLGLNNHIPLSLEIHSGASAGELDLAGLRVVNLRLETGASSMDVTLPAEAGETQVAVSAGMASVKIHVPAGVAARIHTSSGLASVTVDQSRFPQTADHTYESPDYATAANRADVRVETGMGSVEID